MRIVHVATGLNKGGAEGALYRVLAQRPSGDLQVVSMLSGHQHYGTRLRELGIPVTALDFRRRPLRSLIRLRQIVRSADSVTCWMYAACLVGWITRGARSRRLVWMIRHADLSPQGNKIRTITTARICAWLSRWVDVVTFNGEESRRAHLAVGFSSKNTMVLDNGCDTTLFSRDWAARERLRSELGIDDGDRLVLSVARWHPLKDNLSFVRALARSKRANPNIVGLMCGAGIDESNVELVREIEESGITIGSDIRLLGPREDVAHLFSAVDLYVLHSASEAFPNTLIEAMACETPCVATDVGDVGRIVRGTDISVVPLGDPEALANAISDTLERITPLAGRQNRRIVKQRFSLDKVSQLYEYAFTGASTAHLATVTRTQNRNVV